jgi:UDP-N-acetylglucosamine transferase subunit ALG13
VIFVTVGTHHQPFERLLDALATLDGEQLVVQYGPGEAPAGVAGAKAFMPFDEMLSNFRTADVVVTHAGVGSILCARREGHVPLVVPRQHALGEHVDDHQAELTRALERRGSVVAVWDTAKLAEAVAAAPARGSAATVGDPAMCVAVRAALRGEPAPQPSSA